MLGCDSVLFATSDATQFVFEIDDNDRSRLKRISGLTWCVNLATIDSLLPEIVAQMLLYSYEHGMHSVRELVQMLNERNPLGVIGLDRSPGLYEQKVKRLLFAIAQGLCATEVWLESPNMKPYYRVRMRDGDERVFDAYEVGVLQRGGEGTFSTEYGNETSSADCIGV